MKPSYSVYHKRHLKLYNDGKRNIGPRNGSANDNIVFMHNMQSNTDSFLQSSKKLLKKITIQTGMERMAQSDIRYSNNTISEITIADFSMSEYTR